MSKKFVKICPECNSTNLRMPQMPAGSVEYQLFSHLYCEKCGKNVMPFEREVDDKK